jgi:colanic acid/amylovoran biosynthesis glycosyltransferase
MGKLVVVGGSSTGCYAMTTQRRLGYLVPEFPGQTHIFFWRELQVLHGMGVTPVLVSTRLPKANVISHSWARELIAETTYLSELSGGALWDIASTLFAAGPTRWWRCLRATTLAPGLSLPQRLTTTMLIAPAARLVALAKRTGFTHLHVHSCANAANVAMLARLLGDVPYSVTLHGRLADYGPNQENKWRHAAFGIVITKRLKGVVEEELAGALPPTVVIAPMGVDLRRFRREHPYVAWQGKGSIKLFASGRLNPGKGHDDLIRAIGLLKDRGLPVMLDIAGEDDVGGSYRRLLESLIRTLGLSKQVTLLGAVSEQRVQAGLATAHLFCLASLEEALGVAIMEAMAMSLPVVVTRTGGVPELVEDGVEGLMVPVRQPDQLADAIAKLANDPVLAARYGVQGRAKIEREFHAGLSADALVALAFKTPV